MGKEQDEVYKSTMVYMGRTVVRDKPKALHRWFVVDGLDWSKKFDYFANENADRRWVLPKHKNTIAPGAAAGAIYEFSVTGAIGSQTVWGVGAYVEMWGNEDQRVQFELSDKAAGVMARANQKRARDARDKISDSVIKQLNEAYWGLPSSAHRSYFLADLIQRVTEHKKR